MSSMVPGFPRSLPNHLLLPSPCDLLWFLPPHTHTPNHCQVDGWCKRPLRRSPSSRIRAPGKIFPVEPLNPSGDGGRLPDCPLAGGSARFVPTSMDHLKLTSGALMLASRSLAIKRTHCTRVVYCCPEHHSIVPAAFLESHMCYPGYSYFTNCSLGFLRTLSSDRLEASDVVS